MIGREWAREGMGFSGFAWDWAGGLYGEGGKNWSRGLLLCLGSGKADQVLSIDFVRVPFTLGLFWFLDLVDAVGKGTFGKRFSDLMVVEFFAWLAFVLQL